MALDFPTTPANGFVYTSPTGEQWTYETATNSWTSKGLVNSSGGIKYVGTLNITAAPPTGVTGGALYTVVADGTANAGFGPGVTGALTKGDSVMNTGTGWIKLSHPTSVWLKTGTNLAPTATGDVVSISAGTAALPGLTPVGDPNTGIYSPGPDQLAISTGGIGRAHVAANGKVGIGVTAPTAAGGILQLNGGITFPATAVASTDPNTLDDYEEGTWTPTQDTFDTWTTPTFTATYTKVGRVVHLNLYQTGGTVGWSALDSISGLPFTPGTISAGYATDTTPVSDNGVILAWTNNRIYFQKANASETGLVFSVTYHV